MRRRITTSSGRFLAGACLVVMGIACTVPAQAQTNNFADLQSLGMMMVPSTPLAGSAFTAQVWTRNAGTLWVTSATVAVWTHHPASASCGESSTAVQALGYLAPGQVTTNTFPLTAPGVAGTAYVIRAFADNFCAVSEANEANNQASLIYAVSSGNTNPPALPDLRISSITLSPARPKANKTFYAYVTVQNSGPGSASNIYVGSWANKAAAAGCGEAPQSEVFVSALGPGASQVTTHMLVAPSGASSGRTFRAFADNRCTVSESSESNNQGTLAY